jgi:hypothetical protein
MADEIVEVEKRKKMAKSAVMAANRMCVECNIGSPRKIPSGFSWLPIF